MERDVGGGVADPPPHTRKSAEAVTFIHTDTLGDALGVNAPPSPGVAVVRAENGGEGEALEVRAGGVGDKAGELDGVAIGVVVPKAPPAAEVVVGAAAEGVWGGVALALPGGEAERREEREAARDCEAEGVVEGAREGELEGEMVGAKRVEVGSAGVGEEPPSTLGEALSDKVAAGEDDG